MARKLQVTANLGENEYDPQDFVEATVYAEELGFTTAWLGDHIFPWYHSGKRSAFAWSVMPVALAKTTRIQVGPFVTVPTGARYHPAIIAQASATLDNLFPGRIQLGVGSGEALNERPFWKGSWPNWEERMSRVVEGIKLIRMLWNSKEPFQFKGKYFPSDFYFLYTKPKKKIPIFVSAIGKKAAFVAGVNGEGLISIAPRNNVKKLKEEILPAYRRGRVESKQKGLGKVCIELAFSFQKPEKLLKTAWRTLGIMSKDSWSLPDPLAVESAGRRVSAEDIRNNVHICRNWRDVVQIIEEYRNIGVNEVTIYTGCEKKQLKAVANNLLSVF